MPLKPKILFQNGDLQYTNTNPRINITIQETDEEGIIWCQNCYKDHKPILTVSLDDIDVASLCEDCLLFLFKFYREKRRLKTDG